MPHAMKCDGALSLYDTRTTAVERSVIQTLLGDFEPTCDLACREAANYAWQSLRAWADMTSKTAIHAWARQARKFLEGDKAAVQPWQAPLLLMECQLGLHLLIRTDQCICRDHHEQK